ncbi:transcription termination/antitermination protein NusG [Wenyingzhuangia sp. IMCC45574]
MADSVKKWYVVRAIGGQENKVKSYIEQDVERFGLSDYVEQVLVPTEKVVQVRNGKKSTRERVYFPGYIMVQANLTGEVPHVIKAVTGVIGFLGETKGGDPVPMRQSEINRMLGKVDELTVEVDNNVAIPYTVGETVKVIDGPFNGFDGIIEVIHEEKRKLEVMVKIFGRKTPLELNYMQVDKIS